MNDAARNRILGRLRSTSRPEAPRPEVPPLPVAGLDPSGRVERLKSLMEAMRAEVHRVPAGEWIPQLKALLRARGLRTLLYAPATPLGAALEEAWREDADGLPELVAYTEPIETFKERLFVLDAAVTSAAGAVADTGALILRPGSAEPRLMSLVPPVHIAVLNAENVFPSLGDAMAEGRWAQDMPTNMLLISGPSKTADIELILAFGVHGPKELIVLIIDA
jgi:L-lactate dehydrogenase complex protein LldG